MTTLKIILYCNGVWDDSFNYLNYKIKGVLLKEDTDFEMLKLLICGVLKENSWETNLDIKYQLEPNQQPVDIDDNESVQFYIELKRNKARMTHFPLCVTAKQVENHQLMIDINNVPLNNFEEEPMEESFSGNTSFDIVKYVELICKNSDCTEEETFSIPADSEIVSTTSVKEVYIGQVFKDKRYLQSCLSFYAIENHFQFKVSKSCTKEYLVNCIDDSCNWVVRASCDGKTKMFVIRRLNNIHTCPTEIRMEEKRQATAAIIGEVIKSRFFNVKTVYTPADIITDMQKKYGVVLSYNKAWRSRGNALDTVRGIPRESYSVLPSFLHMVRQTNPGSVVDLIRSEGNRFKYVFMALDASRKGWIYCRPVIVVDGTFLKSNYGGTLLTASTQDGNGKIFPLAFCVVDSENNESWKYFFIKLKETFEEKDNLCIVSDRHESISNAAGTVFPEARHVICMYHLLGNIKKHFRVNAKRLRDNFFGAARAYTLTGFNYFMEELDSMNAGIRPYLEGIGFDKWARSRAKANRYSTMTSNIAESINASLKAARELPISTLLEYVRRLVQEWTYKNRNIALSTGTKLTNRAENELRENYATSMTMKVIPSVTLIYSVEDGGGTMTVKLKEKECSCGRFQIDEIPCPHAIAVLTKFHLDPYQYCSQFFTKENFLKVYEAVVYPVPSKSEWDVPYEVESIEVRPPIVKLPAGRPKKQRIKGYAEGNGTINCSRCGKKGHNKKTCRGIPK
ncbi:uncharacterized protein LOC126655583 [Mercurialis annua]|uniref:uncharacterized protein LOC126655583 n=1 Tax=Mercurialis annua TaxID=3986 RepID=UPI00215F2693|nr:uncharacterized protein LOC126655583 [Mercurialis annua]